MSTNNLEKLVVTQTTYHHIQRPLLTSPCPPSILVVFAILVAKSVATIVRMDTSMDYHVKNDGEFNEKYREDVNQVSPGYIKFIISMPG